MAVLEDMVKFASEFLESPETFLLKQENVYNESKERAKQFYDHFLQELEADEEVAVDVMTELLIDEFDDEQIWQELELFNRERENEVAKGLKIDAEMAEIGVEEEEEEDQDDDDENEIDMDDESSDLKNAKSLKNDLNDLEDDIDDDDDDDDDVDGKSILKTKSKSTRTPKDSPAAQEVFKKRTKQSVVDDNFFRLDDLSKFLDAEDAREERKRDGKKGEEEDDEDIDLFGDIESEDEEVDNDDDEDDDEEDDEDVVSAFGKDSKLTSSSFQPSKDSSARQIMYQGFFDSPDSESGSNDKGAEVQQLKTKKNKSKVTFEDEEGEKEEDEEEDEDEDEVGDDDGCDADFGDVSDNEDSSSKKPSKEEAADERRFQLFKDDDDDDDNDETNKKSSNEKRLEKLKKRTTELEEQNLGQKEWQMTGEVVGVKRPENSLLEEHLQFDQTPKTGVLITQSFSEALESLVKQRIKDKVFDDVERKIKPVEDPYSYKKRLVNEDEQKSKKSLAEVYESEFVATQTKEEKSNPAHAEIQKKMDSLFRQLDAMANFHFVPRPAAADVTIISNMPTIASEEATPVTAEDSQTLAPEEISSKTKGLSIGAEERSETDKKRDLRKKKKRQREKQKVKEQSERAAQRANPGLGNKYSKEKMVKALTSSTKKKSSSKVGGVEISSGVDASKKAAKSSKAFFDNLQNRVADAKETKKAKKSKKAGGGAGGGDKTAKNLKL